MTLLAVYDHWTALPHIQYDLIQSANTNSAAHLFIIFRKQIVSGKHFVLVHTVKIFQPYPFPFPLQELFWEMQKALKRNLWLADQLRNEWLRGEISQSSFFPAPLKVSVSSLSSLDTFSTFPLYIYKILIHLRVFAARENVSWISWIYTAPFTFKVLLSTLY